MEELDEKIELLTGRFYIKHGFKPNTLILHPDDVCFLFNNAQEYEIYKDYKNDIMKYNGFRLLSSFDIKRNNPIVLFNGEEK